MTTYIEFECGGGTILTGQAAVDAVAEHKAHCPDCPDERTDHEKRADEAAQKAWEARVDAALAEAKETA